MADFKNRRVLISGVPGAGKTAIINDLESRNYSIKKEYSRQLIEHSIKNNSDVVPWENLDEFTRQVTVKRIEQYNDVKVGEYTFYDRGLLDSAPYFTILNQPIPPYLEEAITRYKYYPVVFVTPFWEAIYANDNERKEPKENLLILEKAFDECIHKFGYKKCIVPKLNISERTDFILNYISNNNG